MWKQQIESYVTWLQQSGKAEATIVAYQKDIEQLAEFLMKGGKTDFQQVTAEDIEAFKQDLTTLRYTDKSISRKLNSIKSFFRFLKETDVVAENPVRKVAHPKYKISPPRVFAKTEY